MSDQSEPGDGQQPSDEPSDPRPPDRSDEVADEARPTEVAPTPLTQQVGRVTVVVLATLFGIFAVANAQAVDFSWVFGSTEVVTSPDGERVSGGVPLIALLLASFALGFVVGALVVWQVRRTRRARHRDER